MNLPKSIKTVLRMLTDAGFKAYVVGGAVRDELMKQRPKDYDVCTNARPEETKGVFLRYKLIPKGEKFGTVCPVVGRTPVEITTFRRDGRYSDSRHPLGVEFSNELDTDLSRRDFTVNALAYNEKEGIVDCFSGKSDIENGIIRAVGDPRERFSEDALRIMRALRFSATLGFEMEEETARAATELAPTLKSISAERVRDELMKFVLADRAGDYLLKYKEIVFAVIPELKECDGFDQHNPFHCHDVLGHIAATVNFIDKKPILRMTALLHDVAKPACFTMDGERGRFFGHMQASAKVARVILERLKFPSKFTDTVCLLIEYHDKPYSPTPEDARRWLNRLGAENTYLVIRHKTADCLAHDSSYRRHLIKIRDFKREVDLALKRGDCYCLSRLAVNGRDINRALGIQSGEETGATLEYLLQEVIEGRAENESDKLILLAKQRAEKQKNEKRV